MKKKIQFLLVLMLVFTSSVISQNQTGKKATLNEDGTISVQTVFVPENINPQNRVVDLLFSFGRPANQGIKNSRGTTLADLDGDGVDEIVYGIDTTLYALKGDGTVLFEKTVLGPILLPPTVMDMNEDGIPEIIVNTGYPTTVGRVYVTDNEGVDLPGWPVNYSNHWMINAPAVADVDGNGSLDIITCERAGSTQGFVHVLNLDGTSISSNWPVELPATPAFTPSIGDIDNDGNNDVVIAASSGGIYIFDNQGTVFPGFPVVDPNVRYSYQSPILADLDEDGDLEIIGSNHGNSPGFYVLNHDGTYYPGWPIATSGWTYSPPTVADINGDGVYEIFAADRNTSNDGSPLPTIYGLTPNGTDISNFPLSLYGGNEGVLTIADINNDDVLDIIFGSVITDANSVGYVHAYSTDGSGELDGFPLRPYGFTFLNGAVVGDVDGDGMMDLTANSYTLTFGASVDSTFVNTYNLNVPYDPNKIIRNGYKGSNSRDGLVKDEILGITDFNKNLAIEINPNPSDGTLTIKLPAEIENVSVSIFSIDGKAVFSEKKTNVKDNSLNYNLKQLKSGLYLVNISDGKNTYTGKWIKK